MSSTDIGSIVCGRPKHPIWRHFIRGDKRNKCHFKAYCKFCVDANGIDAVKSVRGVAFSMVRHLESCENCPEAVVTAMQDCMLELKESQQIKQEKKILSVTDDDAVQSLPNKSKKLDEISQPIQQAPKKKCRIVKNSATGKSTLTKSSKMAFQQLIVKATLSARLPWNWIEDPEIHLLLKQCLNNENRIPSKADLSGNLLTTCSEDYFQKYMERIKDSKQGCMLIISSWKTANLQTMFSICLSSPIGETMTFSLQDITQKEDDDKLTIKLEESLNEIRELDIEITAIITKQPKIINAMQHLIQDKHLNILLFPCSMQCLNTLTAELLCHPDCCETVGKVINLVNYISSDISLKAIYPFLSNISRVTCTNWESIFGCVFAFQEHKELLSCIGLDGNVPPHISSILQNESFWFSLEHILSLGKIILRSKDIVTEKNINITDMFRSLVLLLSGFEEYSSSSVGKLLLQRVESIWSILETPLMVLGCMLNFQLQTHFLDAANPYVHWIAIGKYAKYYYEHWFGETPNQLIDDLHLYKEGLYPFERQAMKDYHNPEAFYSCIRDSNPEISRLACRIFSIIPKACTNHFSEQTFASSPFKTNFSTCQSLACLQIQHGILNDQLPFRGKLKTTKQNSVSNLVNECDDPKDIIWTVEEWMDIVTHWKGVLTQLDSQDKLQNQILPNSKPTLKSLLVDQKIVKAESDNL